MAATDERTILEEDSSEENIGHGFLTLTSRRFMFDKIEGLIHKRRIKMLDMPPSNIKNVFTQAGCLQSPKFTGQFELVVSELFFQLELPVRIVQSSE